MVLVLLLVASALVLAQQVPTERPPLELVPNPGHDVLNVSNAQQEIWQSCEGNYAIREINADGSVVCVALPS